MESKPVNNSFIDEIIQADIANNKNGGQVRTRFPPEPNGWLHIGHAKALCIDFLTAERYGGLCNLRFDDTNPMKEETGFVEGILGDIRWLGFDWDDRLYYASDYFEKLYDYACLLIRKGKAFVCDLTSQEMREYRGTLTQPGKESPYRDRTPEENMRLFEAMRRGEFPNGARVLRAKIDMASPNINLRDPVIYRILHATHHHTGDAWCIYPMYDFAHPLEDAIENITHSLCSLEYEDHRPLYDWFLRECEIENPPQQIEFARLNIERVPMSKRYLRRLVEDGYVSGWDDPRMPTLAGLRRRGVPASAIRDFIERVGVAKAHNVVEQALLDHCIRESLAQSAPRVMAVLRPLKVTLTNWPEGTFETLTIENHPDHPEMGERTLRFGRELYIEQDDFMENPPKKFFRLAPGQEVRLKGAYIIKCESVVKDEAGNILELRCTVDLTTKSGEAGSARKVKGTLHWVEATGAKPATVRLYEPLLLHEDAQLEKEDDPEETAPVSAMQSVVENFNPNSITVLQNVLIEPVDAQPGAVFQFMRQGYFACDSDSTPERAVYNRTVSLKDSWAKIAAQ